MKFAHLADCHVGSWRDPKLKFINERYFRKTFDIISNENVDFIIISGDLFNSAVPGIESIKLVVEMLKKMADLGIAVYFIAGSHDFSPGGKTMLDVLEFAGLGINVAKGGIVSNDGKYVPKIFVDPKTGVGICGMLGKRGGLEKSFYQNLSIDHLKEFKGFKIFMFHSALDELKPKELANMDSFPLSVLPKGFDYYAGGHVHIVKEEKIDGYNVVFPGPVFPNSFYELEYLKKGGFFIIDSEKKRFIELDDFPVFSFCVDCNKKNVSEIEDELKAIALSRSFEDGIVTLRLKGELLSGRPSDISFNDLIPLFYDAGAFVVLRNTSALLAKGFHTIKINSSDVLDIEKDLIKEHSDQNYFSDVLTKEIIDILSAEKVDGEKVLDYERRLFSDIDLCIDKVV